MTAVLEVTRLNAGYGDVRVLQDVSLTVGEREVVAVVGANGAGKTTLLSTIAGLVRATTGAVTFLGRDITGAEPHILPGIGLTLVPEGSRLFPFMTVMENLELGGFSQTGAEAKCQRLQDVLELFPVLSSRRGQMAGLLSGGERQMCGIARAMMSNPKLLMLDEPSVGLSPAMVERVFEAVESLARRTDMTVMIVEQNVSEVLRIADRAYVLDHGRVVRSGDAPALRNDREIQETYMGL